MTDGTRADPVPQNFNMAEYCIGRAARETPDKKALLVFNAPNPRNDDDAVEQWGFRDIEKAIRQISTGLARHGLKRGDRVAILGNSSWSALLFFAAISGGYIALPLSSQLTTPEIRSLLEDSGARLIATGETLDRTALPTGVRILTLKDVEELFWCPDSGRYCGSPAPYADTKADDPAFLIYTSGTTSRPKGVLHAHRSAWGRRPMYQGWEGITSDDRLLHAGAFNWTYTLGVGLTDPWANGATSVIYDHVKTPDLWPTLIANTEATIFAAVPGIYRQILKYANPTPADFGKLRHCLVAGETPPPGLFEDWKAATGRELYEALGMSEVSTYISTSPSVPRKPGTVGKPQAGRRIAIISADGGSEPLPPNQEGLIAVHRSDPGLMLGYWKRKDEEAEVYRGDWFTGGDLGQIDEDGYITHLGRANELMNAGGYRVSPLEIEAALARAPGISEVACAEVEVRDGVKIIAAFVVPTTAATTDQVAASTLDVFAKAHLASYKCPKTFVVLEHLPRTANGKIQRRILAQNFAARNKTR